MPKSAALKAAPAAAVEPGEEVEAAPDPQVAIEFGGCTFYVPRSRDDWKTTAMLRFARARTKADQEDALQIQIGEEAWDELVTKAAPTQGEFDAFMVHFSEVVNRDCTG